METKTYPTNYRAAVNWLGGDLILCNEIKDQFNDLSLPYWQNEDFIMEGKEIFQWYLTSYDEDSAMWLHEHFDLTFAYCEELDLYVLLVTHFGTAWDYVYWETDIENASCGLGEDPRAF